MTLSIVLTSINAPGAAAQALAEGACRHAGYSMIVVGDRKSPPRYELEGCEFLSLDFQLTLPFRHARSIPINHYARKNIGYLLAISRGTDLVVETDDDNFPTPGFFAAHSRIVSTRIVEHAGWVNLYRYFTDALVWPRGLPLAAVRQAVADYDGLPMRTVDCPIQQGLADDNPDVDAVYRLILPLPLQFRADRDVAVGRGAWCPFNSQNTAWWPDAFPLLYLPSYCSFRMTDIWRGLVAQRICWENGWYLWFHRPTVRQERNEHDLLRDFADEMPGYLNNHRIACALENLRLQPGIEAIPDNLRASYECLMTLGVIDGREGALLEDWLADLREIREAQMCRSTSA